MVGLVAVATVTYMIVWMRRHSRGIKADARRRAPPRALAAGSTTALVAMAFLAVLREGFETSVFLLAAFQDATDTTAAGSVRCSGSLAAVAIGVGLYRGGVRINLARFFRITGLVLVFVAAGLLATAAHTAHEAGWFNGLQGQALDLSWLVQPGNGLRLAADRDAGPAAAADRRRGAGLRALRGADGALRALAGPAAPAARGRRARRRGRRGAG